MSTETSPTVPYRPPPALLLPAPRRDAVGLAASLLLHAALVLVVVLAGMVARRDAARIAGAGGAGPVGGGGGGGGNGGRVSYIALPPIADDQWATPAPTPQVMEKPEEPATEHPAEPEPEVARAPAGARSDSTAAGAGPGAGAGTGPGSGGGTGGGAGGGVGPGAGIASGPGTGGDSTDILPPQLRNWVPPTEKPPKDLRGRTVRVTFWITAEGRVEKFATDPEIRDRDYLEKFTEIVMKTRFRPAHTRAGVPVPIVYPMDFVLQSGS